MRKFFYDDKNQPVAELEPELLEISGFLSFSVCEKNDLIALLICVIEYKDCGESEFYNNYGYLKLKDGKVCTYTDFDGDSYFEFEFDVFYKILIDWSRLLIKGPSFMQLSGE